MTLRVDSEENCYSLRRNTRITRAIELIQDVAIHGNESGDLSLYILPYYHVTTTESHAYPHSILLQVGAHQLILDQ